MVGIADDDELMREGATGVTQSGGVSQKVFAVSGRSRFRETAQNVCLIADVCMPGISRQGGSTQLAIREHARHSFHSGNWGGGNENVGHWKLISAGNCTLQRGGNLN